MSQATADPHMPPQSATTAPLRLIRPRREADELIRNHIKVGQAIKSQRIVYVDDLQQARREKLDWVTRTTELLTHLFGESTLPEECNDWIGPILPEYADFPLFIAQFIKEMKHRIARLQTVQKHLAEISEPLFGHGVNPPTTKQEVPMVAPIADPPSIDPPPAAGLSGILIWRASEESARHIVGEFLAGLDLSLNIIDQRSTEPPTRLIDRLAQLDRTSFAVILNETPANDGEYLFDLGCCVGKFGASRLCVLHREPTPPSPDPRGVRHIALDPAGAWQLQLARHLKSSGVSIDLNRLI